MRYTIVVIGVLLFSITTMSFAQETRDITDARPILESEWMFQVDGKITKEKIIQQIAWTRQLATRVKSMQSQNIIDLSSELENLGKIESELALMGKKTDKLKEMYFQVRTAKRSIIFKNPLVDFDKILLIDNPFPGISQEPDHEARHRNGFMAQNGGRLLVIDRLNPDANVKQLAPQPGKLGSFWRPDLSYDAQKVVFCMNPEKEQSFHLYEVNVDGSGFKQLTRGDYDDLDPIYLPDGKLLFSTSRANTYIRCMPYTYSFVLARCESDGKNIYIVSRNSECDYLPSMLNNGRVIYSRWEYTDKGLWRVQSLWSMNPDGTNVEQFWGNQSVWPDHTTEPRAIPGSQKVMFTGLGHHQWFNGCAGIINPNEGLNFPNGLYKVSQELAWPECGNGPTDPKLNVPYHTEGNYTATKTPYPLSEEYFLTSLKSENRFKLYLMDIYGNRELIWQGRYNVLHAMPLKKRAAPPIIPDRVKWPTIGEHNQKVENGILYSNNVFEGVPEIPRDKVKYMRIIQMDPKTYSTWAKTVQHDGPAVGITQAESVKFVHGIVPVEKDGSVCFELPPGKAFYFQLIDENYMCIQNMRSFTGVMPGETRGCLACHEKRHDVKQQESKSNTSMALIKGAVKPTPPPWGKESISYTRFVQPVLDEYCVGCHNEKHKNPSLNFKMRPSKIAWRWRGGTRPGEKSPFTEPYVTLIGRGNYVPWGRSMPKDDNGIPDSISGCLIVEGYNQMDPESLKTLPPMTVFSHKSKLIKNAMSGKHHKVKVDGESLRRLIAWVDCNGPYLGKEEIRKMNDPKIQLVDSIPVRPRVGTAPTINRFNVRQDGDSWAIAGNLKLAPDDVFKANGVGTNLLNIKTIDVVPTPYRLQYMPKNAKIISVHYGTNDKQADVTKQFAKLWDSNSINQLTYYNTHFGDPTPGIVKQLVVKYKINGKTDTMTFTENAMILVK